MESVKYPYSKYQSWFAVIALSAMIFGCLYMIIARRPDGDIWQVMVPMILILGALLTYICRKFFFPLIWGETALELDKEKLQYFVNNRIIYWKDVETMDFWSLKYGGMSIRFVMHGTNKDVKINTKYIAGKDQSIYDTIVEYFEKYK